MSHRKEWKKNQVSSGQLDNEIYALLDQALASYKRDPIDSIYNDARLVTREILSNVHKHNRTALILGVDLSANSSHEFKIKIYHDGDSFNPFAEDSGCVLLQALNYDYKFNSNFIATDSGRHQLVLKFDLSAIFGGN